MEGGMEGGRDGGRKSYHVHVSRLTQIHDFN